MKKTVLFFLLLAEICFFAQPSHGRDAECPAMTLSDSDNVSSLWSADSTHVNFLSSTMSFSNEQKSVSLSWRCPIEIVGLAAECNATITSIDYEIVLSGGVLPYIEQANRGSFMDSTFIIDNLPLNTPDTLYFEDANGCVLEYIFTTGDCLCEAEAGVMDVLFAEGCEGGNINSIQHNITSLQLGVDDSLRYYVHTRSDDSLGAIIAILINPIISFSDGPFNCDSLYYISAVVGEWFNDGINLNDQCLDVSPGQPIRFNCGPEIDAGLDTAICQTSILLRGSSSTGSGVWTSLTPSATVNAIDQLNANADLPGLGEFEFLFEATDNACTSGDTIRVTVNDGPTIIAATIDTICNLTGDYYTISFTVRDGDPRTYMVNGDTLNGNQYVSDSIMSGDPYVFVLSDSSGCGSDSISGVFSCECLSSIGDLNTQPIFLCEADSVRAALFYNPAGQVIVGNDVRNYILFSDSSDMPGSIVQLNTSGDFLFDENSMTYGQTYYIVLVIGNQLTPDVVDLSDRCLLTSQAIHVTWIKQIDFNIGDDGTELNCNQSEINLIVETLDDTLGYLFNWSATNGGVVLPADAGRHSLSVTVPGDYMMTISHPEVDCDSSFVVTITQSPDVPFATINEPDTLTCTNDMISLIGDNSSSSPNIFYEWTGPGIVGTNLTANILVDAPGTYVLTVRDTMTNCIVSTGTEVFADQTPPIAMATATEMIDCDTEMVEVSGLSSTIGLFVSYAWSSPDSGMIVGSSTTQNILVGTPGNYEITVTNEENGCTAIASALVELDENYIQAMQSNVTQPACEGEFDGSIEVDLIVGGVVPYEYTFDGGVNYTLSNTEQNLLPGVYIIGVRDINGCELFDTVELYTPVDFSVDLGEDIIVPLGEEVVLNVETDLPFALQKNIAWNPVYDPSSQNDLTQTFLPPNGIGQYEISFSMSNLNDCFESDEINVFVILEKRLYIPSAIRLNSSNRENRFVNIFADPVMVESISDFGIYTRWGNRVFYRPYVPVSLSLDEGFAWDGMIEGEPAAPGVYSYHLLVEYVNGRRELKKGDITILR